MICAGPPAPVCGSTGRLGLPFAIRRTGPILILLILGLFLTGCQSRSYDSGYADGYKEGYSNGHIAGYREGYDQGFFAARPPGGELAGASARWVKFGAVLGALGLLALLLHCAFVLVAADLTPDVAAAKAGAIAGAVVMAAIMIALGAHRFADLLLLAARPESRLATFLLILSAAAPAFVCAAWLRALGKERLATRQQALLAAALAFAACFILAIEIAMMKTPQAERYLVCYLGLGILLGVLGHFAFRLMRKAEGWA